VVQFYTKFVLLVFLAGVQKESVARIELQTIGFDGLLGVIFAE